MRYEATGWIKFAEEDVFSEGCQLGTGSSDSSTEPVFTGKTVEEVIQKCLEFVGVPEPNSEDAIERDACDETGRLDIAHMETADGIEPTERQLEDWKAGQYRLWYVVYIFYIEAVSREPVSLVKPEVARV